MDLLRRLGQQIREARKQRGWTQFELAERVGRSVKTISATERGSQAPSLETLATILEVLDLDIKLVPRKPHGTADLPHLLEQLEPCDRDLILEVCLSIITALRRKRRETH